MQGGWERSRGISFWGDGEAVGSTEPHESGNRDLCMKSLKHQVHMWFHPLSSGLYVGATKRAGKGLQ